MESPLSAKNKVTTKPTLFNEKPKSFKIKGIYVPKLMLTPDFTIAIQTSFIHTLFFKISFITETKPSLDFEIASIGIFGTSKYKIIAVKIPINVI